jgi:predicted Zn-dependent protease
MLTRVLLVLCAVVAIAWLVAAERGAGAESELTALAFRSGRPPTAAELRRADALIARAERLNPDPRPQLYRGVLALRAGDPRRAARIFLAGARAQPRDVEAWGLARTAARQAGDTALEREAAARLRALAPPVPPPPA